MTESRSNGAGLNRRELFITALSAAGVFAALFVRRGFWPFGSGSVLITDLYSQYAPLLYRFYDVVTGRANLFYEFRIAGGLGLYADTVNELVNPFNYLLLLFGRDRIFLALNILVAFYGIAAAVSADFFLQKRLPAAGRLCVHYKYRRFFLQPSLCSGIISVICHESILPKRMPGTPGTLHNR